MHPSDYHIVSGVLKKFVPIVGKLSEHPVIAEQAMTYRVDTEADPRQFREIRTSHRTSRHSVGRASQKLSASERRLRHPGKRENRKLMTSKKLLAL